jgi:hypothetical protein
MVKALVRGRASFAITSAVLVVHALAAFHR